MTKKPPKSDWVRSLPVPVDDKCEDPRTGTRSLVLPKRGGAKPGSGGAALAKGVL